MGDLEEQESFFVNLDNDLQDYFNMPKDCLSPDEHSLLYPIQKELYLESQRYTDRKLIGQGGKKCIYSVQDTKTGRAVAKAVLRVEHNSDQVERFLCEARLTSLLQHPNIISVYDMGIESDEAFFTMKLLVGNTLSDIIKELASDNTTYCEIYSQVTLLEIFIRICDALAYAHSLNVVHLDLKPENIHIGEFGEVQVCDWGLAKVLTDDDQIESEDIADLNEFNNETLSGIIKGTPGYMAPEQCVAKAEKDVRTDVYSLGAILYSLLTYSVSIESSDDVNDMLERTIDGLIVPPCERKPSFVISKSLEAIVMKALACAPEHRYQTVNELKIDLINYMRGFATTAQNAGFFTHAALLVKHHSLISALILTFTLVVIFLTVVFIQQIQEKEFRAVIAQKHAVDSQHKTEQALVLLQEEARKKQAVNEDLVESIKYDLKFWHDGGRKVDKEIAAVRRALKSEMSAENKAILWFRKGMCHFIKQEFNEAVECFKMCPDYKGAKLLRSLSVEQSKLKSDKELLTDRQLAGVVMKLGRYHRRISFALYDSHMRRLRNGYVDIDPEQHIHLVIAMLCAANDCWKTSITASHLKKSDENYALDLAGSRFRQFGSPTRMRLNYLAALKLTSLDVSHSSFFDFTQLNKIDGLEVLNISGCKMFPVGKFQAQILRQSQLKEIILDKDGFSEKSLKMIKDNVTLVTVRPESELSH